MSKKSNPVTDDEDDASGLDAMITTTTDLIAVEDAPAPTERMTRTFSADTDIFDDSDVYYPRLRLAQGLTPEVQNGEARPGDWLLIGNEPVTDVVFIPLMAGKNRRYQLKDEDEVLCRSGDAKVGVGEPGGDCLQCPKAKWQADPRNPKKNAPPSCILTFSYVGYSVTHDQLVSLDLKDTVSQGGAARFINTLIKGRGYGTIGVQLLGAKETGQRGTYYKVVPKVAKDIDESTYEVARMLIPS